MTATTDLVLAAWRLEAGDPIDVELLAGGPDGARWAVSGTVGASSTTTVLMLVGRGDRLTRIPWAAVATIRTQVTPHPGL